MPRSAIFRKRNRQQRRKIASDLYNKNGWLAPWICAVPRRPNNYSSSISSRSHFSPTRLAALARSCKVDRSFGTIIVLLHQAAAAYLTCCKIDRSSSDTGGIFIISVAVVIMIGDAIGKNSKYACMIAISELSFSPFTRPRDERREMVRS